MAFVSRGFRGRRAADADPARVPPGQYVTRDFPVLSAGPTPHTSLELWEFSIVGELDEPRGWTWEQFVAAARAGSQGGVKGVYLPPRLTTLLPESVAVCA